MFIINNEQLKQFYRECQKDKYIGIDTEFFWTQTYEPKLCLIQIANNNNVCLIDPIKYDLDLNFIKKLLLNKKIKKILHSSSQDLRIFFNLFKVLPVNIFDTQIGVLPLGYNNSVSLKQICLNFLGINLEKDMSTIDWRKRPLSDLQIEYAINDVKYLKLLHDRIKEKLIHKKRTSWIIIPHKKILNVENFINKEKFVWKKIKFQPKTKKEFLLIKKFSYIREKIAKKKNIPPKKIISNSLLIKLSKTFDFKKSKILTNIGCEHFKDRVKKINSDKVNFKNNDLEISYNSLNKKVRNLQSILQQKAIKLNIHPSLIANKSEIKEMILEKKIKHFSGWKKKILSQSMKNVIFK